MVHHSFFLLLILFLTSGLFAQDERYFRQILTGELKAPGETSDIIVSQFNVRGQSYRIDLDGDKIEEIVEPQKRDGVDWIEIRNSSQSKVFEAKLLAMGSWSEIYKLKLVQISEKVKAIIIFLDEGKTAGKRFESTARIFVLAYENNDLGKMVLTEGPHFFHERESQRDQYWRRSYNVNVVDMNGDGIREISVQYNHIQRIMQYSERGYWTRL